MLFLHSMLYIIASDVTSDLFEQCYKNIRPVWYVQDLLALN